MFKEFKEFIAKGNVMDMAVGIILGAAFTTIVKSLGYITTKGPAASVASNEISSQTVPPPPHLLSLAVHLKVKSLL